MFSECELTFNVGDEICQEFCAMRYEWRGGHRDLYMGCDYHPSGQEKPVQPMLVMARVIGGVQQRSANLDSASSLVAPSLGSSRPSKLEAAPGLGMIFSPHGELFDTEVGFGMMFLLKSWGLVWGRRTDFTEQGMDWSSHHLG